VSDPAIVLVLLLAGDAADPATQAVIPAMRRPLGDDTVVLVQQSETPRADADALELAHKVHALSAVSLSWEDAARTRVHVRVLLSKGGQRYDYDLAFHPEDQPVERGRAIGLAMTPVLTWAVGATDSPPPSENRSTTAPETLPAPRQEPPAVEQPRESPVVTRPGARTPAFCIDLAGSATVGIGGNALGAGPAAGLRASVLGPFSLHATAGARFGAVSAASATAMTLGVGGGVAARIVRVGTSAHGLEFGARADVLALQVALSEDAGGTSIRRSRWLTAVDLVAEVAWSLDPHFALTAGAGAEIAAGPTSVTVGGTPVDTIPVGRAVGEIGVRVPF
jgi:hypothetical protein